MSSTKVRWVPDEEATTCTNPTCAREFSMLLRKHHCRKCGQIFCGSCAARFLSLPPSFGLEGPQRVCLFCAVSLDHASAVVVTLAGDGQDGFADGPASSAEFSGPRGVAVDGEGQVIVADAANHRVRKITLDGQVLTLAGHGVEGFADGAPSLFNEPSAVIVDREGCILVADRGNHMIRKILRDGSVTTIAGSGSPGHRDAKGMEATFNSPYGLALDVDGSVLIADRDNHCIRKLWRNGRVSTLAGSGRCDGQGNVIVADSGNHCIRRIGTDDAVTTLAGSGVDGFRDGPSKEAKFSSPFGVTLDGEGGVFVADFGNDRIRKILPDGQVVTFAGTGKYGHADGPFAEARFMGPEGIATADGSLIVGDGYSNRIRRLWLENS